MSCLGSPTWGCGVGVSAPQVTVWSLTTVALLAVRRPSPPVAASGLGRHLELVLALLLSGGCELGDAFGGDEGTESSSSILGDDFGEQFPALVRGGCSLERGNYVQSRGLGSRVGGLPERSGPRPPSCTPRHPTTESDFSLYPSVPLPGRRGAWSGRGER